MLYSLLWSCALYSRRGGEKLERSSGKTCPNFFFLLLLRPYSIRAFQCKFQSLILFSWCTHIKSVSSAEGAPNWRDLGTYPLRKFCNVGSRKCHFRQYPKDISINKKCNIQGQVTTLQMPFTYSRKSLKKSCY